MIFDDEYTEYVSPSKEEEDVVRKHVNNCQILEEFKEKFKDLYSNFFKLQEEQFVLFAKKQMDYGPYNISLGTQLKTQGEIDMSLIGIIIRLNDKINRLKNLMANGGADWNNESIEDSFADISTYGLIALLVKKEKWL